MTQRTTSTRTQAEDELRAKIKYRDYLETVLSGKRESGREPASVRYLEETRVALLEVKREIRAMQKAGIVL